MIHAEKVILETNQQGQIINLPILLNRKVFFSFDQNTKKTARNPQKKLQEKGK